MARRPIPGMRTDAQAGCSGQADRAANDGGITRVEAAGDVHRGDVREKRRIVAERPCAKRLASVCVQVDAHAGTPTKGKGIA
jgi:hypothetical protein